MFIASIRDEIWHNKKIAVLSWLVFSILSVKLPFGNSTTDRVTFLIYFIACVFFYFREKFARQYIHFLAPIFFLLLYQIILSFVNHYTAFQTFFSAGKLLFLFFPFWLFLSLNNYAEAERLAKQLFFLLHCYLVICLAFYLFKISVGASFSSSFAYGGFEIPRIQGVTGEPRSFGMVALIALGLRFYFYKVDMIFVLIGLIGTLSFSLSFFVGIFFLMVILCIYYRYFMFSLIVFLFLTFLFASRITYYFSNSFFLEDFDLVVLSIFMQGDVFLPTFGAGFGFISDYYDYSLGGFDQLRVNFFGRVFVFDYAAGSSFEAKKAILLFVSSFGVFGSIVFFAQVGWAFGRQLHGRKQVFCFMVAGLWMGTGSIFIAPWCLMLVLLGFYGSKRDVENSVGPVNRL